MEKKKSSLAVRMSISLVCGLVAGLLLMMLRENLNSTGKEAVWATINSILFQDIHLPQLLSNSTLSCSLLSS